MGKKPEIRHGLSQFGVIEYLKRDNEKLPTWTKRGYELLGLFACVI